MTFSVKQFLSQEFRRNFSSHIIRRNEIVSSNRRNTKNLGLNLALANAGLFVQMIAKNKIGDYLVLTIAKERVKTAA